MSHNFVEYLLGNSVITALISAVLPLLFILPFALFGVLAERKISGYIQDRIGPNRTGPRGLLQTVADITKLIQKEDIIHLQADRPLFLLAPFILFTASYAAFSVIPFTSVYVGAKIDLGVLFLLAITGISVSGILLAGWSSNNKYSLLGAMRSVAQIISYGIPVSIVVLTMLLLTGTLDLHEISLQQSGGMWNWYLFGGGSAEGFQKAALIPFMFVAFAAMFIGTLAEANRTPFDLPESESELVAGYHTEYSGIRFGMFMLAEYGNMFLVSALLVSLFLGGFTSPAGYIGNVIGFEALIPVEQLFWFLFKSLVIVFFDMWVRWSLPRLRLDQLMHFCWKFLIPLTLVNFFIVSLLMLL